MLKFNHRVIWEVYHSMKAAVYSLPEEKIIQICQLEDEYLSECDRIAEECAREGYPSHGANYELRCANVRDWYEEQIDMIMEGIEL